MQLQGRGTAVWSAAPVTGITADTEAAAWPTLREGVLAPRGFHTWPATALLAARCTCGGAIVTDGACRQPEDVLHSNA
jgi:hypothetical protein